MEAINEQVLPQLQASFRSANGQPPHRGWILLAEKPEVLEDLVRSSRDVLLRTLSHEEEEEDTHYTFSHERAFSTSKASKTERTPSVKKSNLSVPKNAGFGPIWFV